MYIILLFTMIIHALVCRRCSDKVWRVRHYVFKVSYAENERLNRIFDRIQLDFVEREATPEFLMKLSIQLHLSGLSLSNTIRILYIFGVQALSS